LDERALSDSLRWGMNCSYDLETAVVSYVLAVPLVPGWLPIRSMFKKIGSCSTLDQILGSALLIPLISVVMDAGLIFGVWGFFDRIKSRGLGADNILHMDR